MKNETEALNEAIISVQLKRENEKELLLEQWHGTYENLKPINYFKNKLKDGFASSKMKSIILVTAVGLGTAYLLKRMLFGASRNPAKRMFNLYMQYAVVNYIINHAKDLKSVGVKIFDRYG